MKNNLFEKWLNSWAYFIFCFVLGAIAWSFSLCPRVESQKTGEVQLSSIAEENTDVSQTDYSEINSQSDEEILQQLENIAKQEVTTSEPYEISPEVIAEYDEQIENKPKEIQDQFIYEQIADDSALVSYEDPKKCAPARLFYEKQILASSQIKTMIKNVGPDSKLLPLKCVTHIMNKYGVPNRNLAVCAKASGAPRIPGAKPCVTDNLVSLTYHAYVDVAECLNLNPKDLLPKIYNESGFLLNTYGSGRDAGIGQLTYPAIEETNKVYDTYFKQMELAAKLKPSCARVMRYKSFLSKVSSSPSQRCSLMGLPENPIRNVVYLAIFNRLNMDRFSGVSYLAGSDYLNKDNTWVPVKYDSTDDLDGTIKKLSIKEKLEKLGIKNPNLHFFKDVLTYAGYNMGAPTSQRLLIEYLDKRLAARKPVTLDDFDFNNTKVAKDIDGSDRSVVAIARANIMSTFIGKKDAMATKLLKVKRRRDLPKTWALSYLKTFPEYLTYRANAYNGKAISRYSVYGFPGYLNAVAEKNKSLRDTFQNAVNDPNYCSNPNYLKVK